MLDQEMIGHRDEIARRLAAQRQSCRTRVQPCFACHSEIFDGCYALAEAVLTPVVEETPQGSIIG